MIDEPGAIVMAAYDPDPILFERQLKSIQVQTVRQWTCIISVDGDREPVAELVARIVPGDQRFQVIGDGTRLGFYLNFERALRAVPSDVRWVALSDQDDYSYSDKLAVLLPHLNDVSLVSGQARLVEFPSGRALGTTSRADLGAVQAVLANQYTGSLCVFDAEILRTALPKPRVNSKAAAHDHWLAIVARAHRGARIVDVVVQDYVQHAANVFGDPSRSGFTWSPVSMYKRFRASVIKETGRMGVKSALHQYFWIWIGWRQVLVEAVADRTGSSLGTGIDSSLGFRRSARAARRLLNKARKDGFISREYSLWFWCAWLAGSMTRGRARAHQVALDKRY